MEQSWPRIIIFSVLTIGSIWWLSSKVSPNEGRSAGNGRVKSSFFESSSAGAATIKVLGEKINEVVPDSVKKQVGEISEKIFKKSSQVIEQTEIIGEIKTTIDRATEEIEGFPEKQKKDVKKEVIRQVCQELMEEMESE
ncbi:hypothetical protein KKD61_03175 [Patescibacteria group bacterium]|nr:hypothetical protein [Patescibacteria group bacterium]